VVNLVDEGLDLGVRIGALPDSSLVANPAGFVRRVVCASPKYLAQHGTPRAPADLAHHACLRFSGIGSIHDWTFVDDRRSRSVAVAGPLSGNQAEPLIEACADGLGIGMFLSYQIAALTAKRRLVEVLAAFAPPPLPVNVVYPQARLLPARTRAFAADLRAGLARRIA
jgi:DNA-binding transcriptional LysR family regulator